MLINAMGIDNHTNVNQTGDLVLYWPFIDERHTIPSPLQNWSIIIFCYNEAGTIEKVVVEVKVGYERNGAWHVRNYHC